MKPANIEELSDEFIKTGVEEFEIPLERVLFYRDLNFGIWFGIFPKSKKSIPGQLIARDRYTMPKKEFGVKTRKYGFARSFSQMLENCYRYQLARLAVLAYITGKMGLKESIEFYRPMQEDVAFTLTWLSDHPQYSHEYISYEHTGLLRSEQETLKFVEYLSKCGYFSRTINTNYKYLIDCYDDRATLESYMFKVALKLAIKGLDKPLDKLESFVKRGVKNNLCDWAKYYTRKKTSKHRKKKVREINIEPIKLSTPKAKSVMEIYHHDCIIDFRIDGKLVGSLHEGFLIIGDQNIDLTEEPYMLNDDWSIDNSFMLYAAGHPTQALTFLSGVKQDTEYELRVYDLIHSDANGEYSMAHNPSLIDKSSLANAMAFEFDKELEAHLKPEDLALLNDALETSPEDLKPEIKIHIMRMLANSCIDRKCYKQAIKFLKMLNEMQSTAAVRLDLADCFMELKNYHWARHFYCSLPDKASLSEIKFIDMLMDNVKKQITPGCLTVYNHKNSNRLGRIVKVARFYVTLIDVMTFKEARIHKKLIKLVADNHADEFNRVYQSNFKHDLESIVSIKLKDNIYQGRIIKYRRGKYKVLLLGNPLVAGNKIWVSPEMIVDRQNFVFQEKKLRVRTYTGVKDFVFSHS